MSPQEIHAALRGLKEQGASFEDCLTVFGTPAAQSAHARTIINRHEDDLKVDEFVALSRSHRGCWVSAWHYISDEDAESEPLADDLDEMCAAVRNALGGVTTQQTDMYLDWVNDLVYEAALLPLIAECCAGESASVYWRLESGDEVQFVASAVLLELIELSRYGGIDADSLHRLEGWLRERSDCIDYVCGRIYRSAAAIL